MSYGGWGSVSSPWNMSCKLHTRRTVLNVIAGPSTFKSSLCKEKEGKEKPLNGACLDLWLSSSLFFFLNILKEESLTLWNFFKISFISHSVKCDLRMTNNGRMTTSRYTFYFPTLSVQIQCYWPCASSWEVLLPFVSIIPHCLSF